MIDFTHADIERLWNSIVHYVPERQKLDCAIDEKIPNGWGYEYAELWGMPGSQLNFFRNDIRSSEESINSKETLYFSSQIELATRLSISGLHEPPQMSFSISITSNLFNTCIQINHITSEMLLDEFGSSLGNIS